MVLIGMSGGYRGEYAIGDAPFRRHQDSFGAHTSHGVVIADRYRVDMEKTTDDISDVIIDISRSV